MSNEYTMETIGSSGSGLAYPAMIGAMLAGASTSAMPEDTAAKHNFYNQHTIENVVVEATEDTISASRKTIDFLEAPEKDYESQIISMFSDFASKQESLEDDFKKVLQDNLQSLLLG